MARLRQQVAVAAIVAGAILVVASAALIANAIWLGARLVPSNQVHDTYFVVPSAWITLLIFGVGAIADMAFRSQARRFGRRAALIWRTHLLFTTGLIIAWLVVVTQAEMTWQVMIVVYATYPLMLVAHGAALAAGAMIVLRTGKQA